MFVYINSFRQKGRLMSVVRSSHFGDSCTPMHAGLLPHTPVSLTGTDTFERSSRDIEVSNLTPYQRALFLPVARRALVCNHHPCHRIVLERQCTRSTYGTIELSKLWSFLRFSQKSNRVRSEIGWMLFDLQEGQVVVD